MLFNAAVKINEVFSRDDLCDEQKSMCFIGIRGAILEPVDRILEPFDNRVSYLFLNCSQVKKFRISLFFILSKDIGKTFHLSL